MLKTFVFTVVFIMQGGYKADNEMSCKELAFKLFPPKWAQEHKINVEVGCKQKRLTGEYEAKILLKPKGENGELRF